MGKADTITKEYIRRPDIFADVFNQFLYQGRQVILPGKLTELDTAEIAVPYGADQASVPEQRYRDVKKLLTAMTDGKAAYCILAAENENKVNYAMPVKDGLYDFVQLAKQVNEAAASHRKAMEEGKGRKPVSDEYLSGFWKEDRLLPVVTLVIYYGADAWDGPVSLREMYADCDEAILSHAADYRINLIAPAQLSETELDGFHTSFREVMKYIKYSSDGKKLKAAVDNDERFQSVERQAVDVINVVTGSKVSYPKGEEAVNVCLALQEIKAEGRQEGRQEGRLEGRLEGQILAYKKLNVPRQDAMRYLMDDYQKDEKEAETLIEKYWK